MIMMSGELIWAVLERTFLPRLILDNRPTGEKVQG